MIVITSLSTLARHVLPGDEFHLTICDSIGCDVVIQEVITVSKTIDFIASFRFTLEDGTCPGFHLTGVFANKAELPKELKEAKMLEDLSPEQYTNFVNSVGVKISKKTNQLSKPQSVLPFDLFKSEEGLEEMKEAIRN